MQIKLKNIYFYFINILNSFIYNRQKLRKVYLKILKDFPQIKDIELFIETGTYKGVTIQEMSPYFKKLYTIELNHGFYLENKKRIRNKKIKLFHGESTKILRTLLFEITEPAFIFLDAHFSGGKTSRGKLDVPLLQEVKLIQKRNLADVIVIDDYRLFGTNQHNENWSNISEANILKAFKNRHFNKIIYGDKLILVLK